MALGTLTLSTTQGVQGRPFQAAISGLTTGIVGIVGGDGAGGFYVSNGSLFHDALPYAPTTTAVLREYDPGAGMSVKDTRIDITVDTRFALEAAATAAIGDGRSLTSFTIAGAVDESGSLVYSTYATNDLGARAVVSVGAAAGPFEPATLYEPYVDDFSGTPTLLASRPNWARPSNGTSEIEAIGGYAKNTVQYGTEERVLFGDQVTSGGHGANFIAKFQYIKDNSIDGDTAVREVYKAFYLYYIDPNNYARFQPDSDNLRWSLLVRQGGVNVLDSTNGWIVTSGTGSSMVPYPGETEKEVIMVARNGKVKWFQGTDWLRRSATTLVYPFHEMDFTSLISEANRHGWFGIRMSQYRQKLSNRVSVDNLRLDVDDYPAFVPVSAADGDTGTITVTGYADQTPTDYGYRVLDPDLSTVVQDYERLTGFSMTGATAWTGTMSIPVGGPYVPDIGTNSSLGYHSMLGFKLMCGDFSQSYGQSNSEGFEAGEWQTDGTTPTAADAAAYQAEGGTAAIPAGRWSTDGRPTYGGNRPNGGFEIANVMANLSTRPYGMQACGTGGEFIAALRNGGGSWPAYVAKCAAAGGSPENVFWIHGESDADNAASIATYPAQLAGILSDLRTFHGNATLRFGIGLIGRFGSNPGDTTPPGSWTAAQANSRRNEIHQAGAALVASDAYTYFAAHTLGCTHADNYHLATTGRNGYAEFGRRMAWSLAKQKGLATHDGFGAKWPTTSSLSGVTVTIPVNLDGFSGISGTNLDGFEFSQDNGVTWTALAAASCQVSGSNVVLTLPGTPAGLVKWRYFHGCLFNDVSLISCSSSDAADFPMGPSIYAIPAVAA